MWKRLKEEKRISSYEEWILDALYLTGLMIYVVVQWDIEKTINDALFLLLLTFATLFLNKRQKMLYFSLSGEDGKRFFDCLKSSKSQNTYIRTIFLNVFFDLFALLFAILFVIVIWHFHIWQNDPILKAAFCCLLFGANIPTGLAIVRLLSYFYFCHDWILHISFKLGVEDNLECRYIRSLRNQVLYTAVIYCTTSLSSVLFTKIELNFLVVFYTIFAFVLIISTILLTNYMMSSQKKIAYMQTCDQINSKINNALYQMLQSDQGEKSDVEYYFQIKEWLKQQGNGQYDITRFLSATGMLLIAVIPILLQYILENL